MTHFKGFFFCFQLIARNKIVDFCFRIVRNKDQSNYDENAMGEMRKEKL